MRVLKASLAAVLLALAGCDSLSPVDFDALSHEPAALVGTWDLEGLWSYWSGSREEGRPGEAGYAEAWTFFADGTTVHVMESDGESRTRESTYEVVAEPGRTPHLAIGSEAYLFGVDGDRLILLQRGVGDAPEEVYRRRD